MRVLQGPAVMRPCSQRVTLIIWYVGTALCMCGHSLMGITVVCLTRGESNHGRWRFSLLCLPFKWVWKKFSVQKSVHEWAASHAPRSITCALTCVFMASVIALNHSLMADSLSDWMRSSVPCRVFTYTSTLRQIEKTTLYKQDTSLLSPSERLKAQRRDCARLTFSLSIKSETRFFCLCWTKTNQTLLSPTAQST